MNDADEHVHVIYPILATVMKNLEIGIFFPNFFLKFTLAKYFLKMQIFRDLNGYESLQNL